MFRQLAAYSIHSNWNYTRNKAQTSKQLWSLHVRMLKRAILLYKAQTRKQLWSLHVRMLKRAILLYKAPQYTLKTDWLKQPGNW